MKKIYVVQNNYGEVRVVFSTLEKAQEFCKEKDTLMHYRAYPVDIAKKPICGHKPIKKVIENSENPIYSFLMDINGNVSRVKENQDKIYWRRKGIFDEAGVLFEGWEPYGTDTEEIIFYVHAGTSSEAEEKAQAKRISVLESGLWDDDFFEWRADAMIRFAEKEKLQEFGAKGEVLEEFK